MKRFFLVVSIAAAVLFTGAVIFLATFDADRYRPLVVKQLEAATGASIRLDRISLGWHGGVALDLHHLAVIPKLPASPDPAMEVARAAIVVRWLPLLRKDIQIASVSLAQPRIHLRRGADGTVGVVGLAVGPATDGTPSAAGRVPPRLPAGGSSAAPMGLLVSSLEVTDGTVRLTDETAQPAIDVTLHDINATVKDLSLAGPIRLRVSLAFVSDRPNVTVSGTVYPPHGGQAGRLEHLRIEADLSRVDVEALGRAVPSIAHAGLRAGLAGILEVGLDRLALDPKGLADCSARVRLSQGRVAWSALRAPLEQVTVELIATPGRVELTRGSAAIAGGTVKATAAIEHLATTAEAAFRLEADAIQLDRLLPSSEAEPHLQGRLAASFQGTSRGLTGAAVARTFAGEGRVRVSDGKILKLNLLREALARLSMLPGLMERLEARLPESSKAKLAEEDTVLELIEVPIVAERGMVRFTTLRLATDLCELEGTAALGLDGTFTGPLMLRIEPELSGAIVQSVSELQHLTDAKGRVEFPVMLQGTLPHVTPFPDIQYVASRLVVSKAQELLGNFLQKALERGSETETPPAP